MNDGSRIAFIHNSRVPETEVKAKELVTSLNLMNKAWISSAGELSKRSVDLETADLVVVVGGDGTNSSLGVPARWIAKVTRGGDMLEKAKALLKHRMADAEILPATAAATATVSGSNAKL